MVNYRIEKLRLDGLEAEKFFESFFCPSKEEKLEREEIREQIEKNVTITKTERGFFAEIADLDLSFLDDVDKSLCVSVTKSAKAQQYVTENNCFSSVAILTTRTDDFSSCKTGEWINIAA